MGQWGHLYGKRWRKRARYQLQIEPLCRMCKSEGRITAASVADHVIPHRGNINSFWLGELQSLCTFHHNSTKKIIEERGYDPAIGVDGMPLDPRHPIYRSVRRS
jgi:5-methylcytosine-specific restriction enzyme A